MAAKQAIEKLNLGNGTRAHAWRFRLLLAALVAMLNIQLVGIRQPPQ